MILKGFFLTTLLVSLLSCTMGERIELGKSSYSNLVDIEGEPESSSSYNPNSTTHYYKDVAYQVDNDLVVAKYTTPESRESSVPYWKSKWDDQKLLYQVVPSSNPHGPTNLQIVNPSAKQTIIIDGRVGKVVRIIEYDAGK